MHKASVPSKMTTQADDHHLSSRPDTAFGDRRRRTEPLDAIRNSIAGLRKRTSTLNPTNRQSVQERRPSSRMTGLFGTQNDHARHEFTSEDECKSKMKHASDRVRILTSHGRLPFPQQRQHFTAVQF